jgi:hypothetical protein
LSHKRNLSLPVSFKHPAPCHKAATRRRWLSFVDSCTVSIERRPKRPPSTSLPLWKPRLSYSHNLLTNGTQPVLPLLPLLLGIKKNLKRLSIDSSSTHVDSMRHGVCDRDAKVGDCYLSCGFWTSAQSHYWSPFTCRSRYILYNKNKALEMKEIPEV